MNTTRSIAAGLGVAGETLRYTVFQKHFSTYMCRNGKESDVYTTTVTGVVFRNSLVRMRIFILSFRLRMFRAFSWHNHNDCRLGRCTEQYLSCTKSKEIMEQRTTIHVYSGISRDVIGLAGFLAHM